MQIRQHSETGDWDIHTILEYSDERAQRVTWRALAGRAQVGQFVAFTDAHGIRIGEISEVEPSGTDAAELVRVRLT